MAFMLMAETKVNMAVPFCAFVLGDATLARVGAWNFVWRRVKLCLFSIGVRKTLIDRGKENGR